MTVRKPTITPIPTRPSDEDKIPPISVTPWALWIVVALVVLLLIGLVVARR